MSKTREGVMTLILNLIPMILTVGYVIACINVNSTADFINAFVIYYVCMVILFHFGPYRAYHKKYRAKRST